MFSGLDLNLDLTKPEGDFLTAVVPQGKEKTSGLKVFIPSPMNDEDFRLVALPTCCRSDYASSNGIDC